MLTRRQRLRRAAILCCSCTRNLAYYRAGWDEREPIFEPTRLDRTINSNFIDMAILEWSKLFHTREKQSWTRIVSTPELFEERLFEAPGLDERSFRDFLLGVRTYRDKFVAHLDSEPVAYVPKLDVPKASTIFYYSYLLTHENDGDIYEDGPRDLSEYFNDCTAEARQTLYKSES